MPSIDRPSNLGTVLLQLARGALQRAVDGTTPAASWPEADGPDALAQPGATFVTLTQKGLLRGCIGSLQAWRPLGDDVQANAVAAGLRDPRFAPLAAAELSRTRFEVSLLSAPEHLPVTDESDALNQLRPGIDGVILECGHYRSTFLPQVWEQLPEPRVFLQQLKNKAGLPPTFWAPELRLQRYTVTKWKEAL